MKNVSSPSPSPGNLFILVFLLLGFTLAGCSKDDDDVIPEPDLSQLYSQSIRNAMLDDAANAIDTLWPITADNTNLQWKTINGQQYVLMATYMRFPASYPIGDSINTTWGEGWFFIPSQMKRKLGPVFTPTTDTILRINQLLGLPPVNSQSNTHVAQLWVPAERLYRPAGNPSITTTTTGSALVEGVSEEYINWFNNYIIFAYYRPLTAPTQFHYPWTRLGYTYDWAPGASRVGVSEYVLKAGTGCWVENMTTAAAFFR